MTQTRANSCKSKSRSGGWPGFKRDRSPSLGRSSGAPTGLTGSHCSPSERRADRLAGQQIVDDAFLDLDASEFYRPASSDALIEVRHAPVIAGAMLHP